MRKRIIAALLLIVTLMMAGCDTSIIAPVRDEESGLLGDALINEDVETTDVAIAEPETTDDTGVVVTTGEDGETVLKDEDGTPIVRSYLTGKLIKLNEQWTRPLAVMMNNIKEGCPQSGIESAAIVYEFPVEGRITRLMGIFENYNKIPDKIGSIRSSRDYFVYTALEYDAIYAHFGQATVYVGELLNSPSVDNISGAVSGIDNPATSTFYRSSDRKAPHNVYVSKEGLLSDVEKFGYRTTLRLDYQQKFTFPAKQGDRVTYADKPDALVLYPGGKRSGLANGFSNVSARFEYNPEDGKYYRFEYGGKHIDKETGNQLAYDNVIFQYCHGEVRDSHDYLAFGLHGDNGYKVQVFTNGKMVEGTWSRGTDTGYMPALYVDKDGKPITINEGKTWICMIWDEYSDDVVIE